MVEKKGRLEYLRGNSAPVNETQSEKMLRMLAVQHPPESTPEQFLISGFPQRQIMDILQKRVENPEKNRKSV